jgi:hypothetical protein
MATTARGRCHAATVDEQLGTTFNGGTTTEALAWFETQPRPLLMKAAARIVASTALLLLVYFQIPIGGGARPSPRRSLSSSSSSPLST